MAKLTKAQQAKRDAEIISLKENIEERKAQLTKDAKYKPKTNQVIPILATNYNLNVMKPEQLATLLAIVTLTDANLASLGTKEENRTLGSFTIQDWIHDLKGAYNKQMKREKEKELEEDEKFLESLLSEDFQENEKAKKENNSFAALKAKLSK